MNMTQERTLRENQKNEVAITAGEFISTSQEAANSVLYH
jgi:hypothetical protein